MKHALIGVALIALALICATVLQATCTLNDGFRSVFGGVGTLGVAFLLLPPALRWCRDNL